LKKKKKKEEEEEEEEEEKEKTYPAWKALMFFILKLL